MQVAPLSYFFAGPGFGGVLGGGPGDGRIGAGAGGRDWTCEVDVFVPPLRT